MIALTAGDLKRASQLAEGARALLPGSARGLNGAAARAGTFMTLAAVAGEHRDHTQAAAILQRAAVLLKAVDESRMRDVLLAEVLIRLGNTLRLAGKYPEAADALETARTLPNWERLDPLNRAAVLNAMGILAKDTGHYEQATRHYAGARDLMTEAPGQNIPVLAGLHHNIAGLFHVQGRYDEAEPEIRTALVLRARCVPPDTAGTAADLSVLGAVLAGLGRLQQAEGALRKSLQLWSSQYGPEHYEIAVQLNNLSSVQQQRGDLDSAAAGYAQALQIKERVLGRNHPEIAALLNNIASLEADQGQTAKAKVLYDEALAIFGSTLGPEHPSTRTCSSNLRRLAGPSS